MSNPTQATRCLDITFKHSARSCVSPRCFAVADIESCKPRGSSTKPIDIQQQKALTLDFPQPAQSEVRIPRLRPRRMADDLHVVQQ